MTTGYAYTFRKINDYKLHFVADLTYAKNLTILIGHSSFALSLIVSVNFACEHVQIQSKCIDAMKEHSEDVSLKEK